VSDRNLANASTFSILIRLVILFKQYNKVVFSRLFLFFFLYTLGIVDYIVNSNKLFFYSVVIATLFISVAIVSHSSIYIYIYKIFFCYSSQFLFFSNIKKDWGKWIQHHLHLMVDKISLGVHTESFVFH